MNAVLSVSLVLPLLLGGEGAGSPSTAAERIVAAARADSRAMEHLDHLVNRIGPRLTGSAGLASAAEWAREQFASFGLEASLQEWGALPVGFERGHSTGRMLAPVEMALEFGSDAWSAGTRGKVRGRAVVLDGTIEDLARATDVRGTWLLVPGDAGCGGSALAAEPLARHGIAGVVRRAGERIVTGGAPAADWENLPSVPAVILRASQWDELARRARDGQGVVLELDVRNHFRKGPIAQHNVVAELRGRELPDEIVIVGAHLDSWDGATGATDDGAGCAAVIEAARLLSRAGVAPRRTIRFVLWSGEEQGLLGSRGMLRLEPGLAERVSAVLVLDGGTNAISGISAPSVAARALAAAFEPVTRLDPELPFAVRASAAPSASADVKAPAAKAPAAPGACVPAPCPPSATASSGAAASGSTTSGSTPSACTPSAECSSAASSSSACAPSQACAPSAACDSGAASSACSSDSSCSSDDAAFRDAGIPAFLLEQSGRADYARTHHTELDTYDAVIPEYTRHNALALALGALGVADLPSMLPRDAAASAKPATGACIPTPGCTTACPPR